MESMSSTRGYVFDPSLVAATLWRRYRRGASTSSVGHHALLCIDAPDGVMLRVPMRPESPVDIFRLWVPTEGPASCRLEGLLGTASLTLGDLARSEPDPLWDSADGICSHMEKDHADTFPLFCQLLGLSASDTGAEILMPWVESSGFFLSGREGPAFVPFPERCQSANSVRATLITMLRGARAASSQ